MIYKLHIHAEKKPDQLTGLSYFLSDTKCCINFWLEIKPLLESHSRLNLVA